MLTASAVGCDPQALAPGAPTYPNKSQTQAAVDFIKSHPNQVKVVTISIGGNDVDGCPTQPDPTGCVKANMPPATKNLTKIVKQLRAAGGQQMRIIGSTYPDVELGLWVHPTVLGAHAGPRPRIDQLLSGRHQPRPQEGLRHCRRGVRRRDAGDRRIRPLRGHD